jgi:hypothetical protein
MNEVNELAGAPGRDLSRQDTTDPDTNFTLSLEQAMDRYARAGHPRTIRSLQRYCTNGHLDAKKVATTLGDKYLVTPQSVARHIAQIEELHSLDMVATGHDMSRPVATAFAPQHSEPVTELPQATEPDKPRQDAKGDNDVSRYVVHLERQVEQAKDERDFLREQIDRKDKTIDALLERDRETNYLVRGLQEMLSPLLSIGRREPPSEQRTQ